jgi:hypothetical protein
MLPSVLFAMPDGRARQAARTHALLFIKTGSFFNKEANLNKGIESVAYCIGLADIILVSFMI